MLRPCWRNLGVHRRRSRTFARHCELIRTLRAFTTNLAKTYLVMDQADAADAAFRKAVQLARAQGDDGRAATSSKLGWRISKRSTRIRLHHAADRVVVYSSVYRETAVIFSGALLKTRCSNWRARNALGWWASCFTQLVAGATADGDRSGCLGSVRPVAVDAPLVFDDAFSVINNPSIVRLWPPVGDATHPGPLNPPPELPTSGRPLVNLELGNQLSHRRIESVGIPHRQRAVAHAVDVFGIRDCATDVAIGVFCRAIQRIGRPVGLRDRPRMGRSSAEHGGGRVHHAANRTDGRAVLPRDAVREHSVLDVVAHGPDQMVTLGGGFVHGRHGLEGDDGVGAAGGVSV